VPLLLNPADVLRALHDVGGREALPLVLAGEAEPTAELRARLLEGGGDLALVRDASDHRLSEYDVEGAGILVYSLRGQGADTETEAALELAVRKGVEIVAIAVDATAAVRLPYVPAVDVVTVAPGFPVPFDGVAARIAVRAGDRSHALAARVPSLRPGVSEQIVRGATGRNALIGAAVFLPGVDFPVLTLNQIRMVLRLAAAHGEKVDRERVPEILGVVLVGLGWRGLARQLLGRVPGPSFVVKAGVAAAGTKTIGEAATAYFASGGSRSVRRRS
jgi:uncharacterized protein (DUF697 family)